jgi:thioredoxin 1
MKELKHGSDIKKKGIEIVVFYGTWCRPCKLLSKSIESKNGLESKYTNVQFYHVDIDKDEESDITTIPLTIVYKNGEVIGKISGYEKNHTESEIETLINS